MIKVRGRTLAGKQCGQIGKPPVLALHDWLDNANSFGLNGSAMNEFNLFALDFAGHGYSDHRPEHIPYLEVQDVNERPTSATIFLGPAL